MMHVTLEISLLPLDANPPEDAAHLRSIAPDRPSVSLRGTRVHSYILDMRLHHEVEGLAEIAPYRELITVDAEALLAAAADSAAYGSALSRMVFASAEARRIWMQAHNRARGVERPLRVRLILPGDDAAVHRLRWEQIYDPTTDQPLTLDGRVRFSRFPEQSFGPSGRLHQSPPQRSLRCLIVVANPINSADFRLAAIDPVALTQRLTAIDGIAQFRVLARGAPDGVPTFEQVLGALADADLVFLAAHGGRSADGRYVVYLETAHGRAHPVPVTEWRERVAAALRLPRVLFLAACAGSGSGYGDEALTSLGPLLVAAGTPAVVAMQGDVAIQTAADLAVTFFRELARSGQVEDALTLARQQVFRTVDWWVPVLYSRLTYGMIWRTPPEPAVAPAPHPFGAVAPYQMPLVAEEVQKAALAQLARLPLTELPAVERSLPPGSLMPLQPQRYVVGREDDLRALAATCKTEPGLVALVGSPGVGASQLAAAFVHRYGRFFAGVFWIACDQAASLPAAIAQCGGMGRLGLFTAASALSLAEQAALVQAHWSSGLPYLIIFDNCHDPEVVRSLQAYLPGGAARVVITGRVGAWTAEATMRVQPVRRLARAQSVELLQCWQPSLSAADANVIAAELDDWPLALQLAGRFLVGPGRSLSAAEYVQELRSPRLFVRLALPDEGAHADPERSPDLLRTIALSYDQLQPEQALDAFALQLLARLAYLAPGELIPATLLTAPSAETSADLEERLRVERALIRLENLGLVERGSAAEIAMPRLIGAYLRIYHPDPAAQAVAEQAVLEQARAVYALRTGAVQALAELQPILRAVVDAAFHRTDVVAANLCAWQVAYLERLGAEDAALPYAERALAIRQAVYGAQDLATAISHNDLGSIYRALGDLDRAVEEYVQALTIREARLAPDDPAIADVLNNLGWIAHRRSGSDEALALYTLALAIYERHTEGSVEERLICRNNLAALVEERGDITTALDLYTQVRVEREQRLGAQHPDYADTLNNLARLSLRQGDVRDALHLYDQALTIYTYALGPTHPRTALARANRAYAVAQGG